MNQVIDAAPVPPPRRGPMRWRFWGRVRELSPSTQALVVGLRWRCEHLSGWIAFSIALFFSLMFVLIPHPEGHWQPAMGLGQWAHAPVPWALSAWCLLSLANLLRLHRGLRGDVYTYAVILLECGVLFALIWAFHIQFEQGPGFSLKAPALFYAFVLIALRALLLRVRYVLFAGGLLILGWLVLVWYAWGVELVTQNYLTHMRANGVLLRAEVHKLVALALVTGILALVVAIARLLLRKAVTSHEAVRVLSQFVPERVAMDIEQAGGHSEVVRGVEREATILFTDIAGFTEYGEQQSPAELMRTLNDYFAQIAEPIERHGGVICQFQGDAILACFNLPHAQSDHAKRALLAARDILRAQCQGRIAMKTRVGINTGLAVGGLVGTAERKSYTLHGDDVNLASRIEQLNKRYGTRVLLSARTRELAGALGQSCREIGVVKARGRQMPTRLYTLDL